MTHQSNLIVNPNFGDEKNLKEHARRLTESLNGAIQGRLNVSGEISLALTGTTTTVYQYNATPHTVPILVPLNANAATELSNVYVSSRTDRSFELTHSESSATRRFAYIVIG